MSSLITTTLVAILLIILGAVNMTGNISSLHSYHRNNVREEDKKPMGRIVGAALILVGLAILAFGILLLLAERKALPILTTIGTGILIGGICIGLPIMLFAIKKYNKSIF
jgi:uncharacterized membrane protein